MLLRNFIGISIIEEINKIVSRINGISNEQNYIYWDENREISLTMTNHDKHYNFAYWFTRYPWRIPINIFYLQEGNFVYFAKFLQKKDANQNAYSSESVKSRINTNNISKYYLINNNHYLNIDHNLHHKSDT